MARTWGSTRNGPASSASPRSTVDRQPPARPADPGSPPEWPPLQTPTTPAARATRAKTVATPGTGVGSGCDPGTFDKCFESYPNLPEKNMSTERKEEEEIASHTNHWLFQTFVQCRSMIGSIHYFGIEPQLCVI